VNNYTHTNNYKYKNKNKNNKGLRSETGQPLDKKTIK